MALLARRGACVVRALLPCSHRSCCHGGIALPAAIRTALGLPAHAPSLSTLPPHQQVDRTGETDWQERLAAVADPAARAFIALCLAPVEQRTSAQDLLDDPFLQVGGGCG